MKECREENFVYRFEKRSCFVDVVVTWRLRSEINAGGEEDDRRR